ncbi:hypothetical protein DIPPA_35183 [Diplonema papillatum]|nr:hypothetical protein DIPPA_35183 [Diplonema papillatum]
MTTRRGILALLQWAAVAAAQGTPSIVAPTQQKCTMYSACRDRPSCCPAGTACFQQSIWYSQCVKSCPGPDWDCHGTTTPAPATTPSWLCSQLLSEASDCAAAKFCCDVGLTCYEERAGYAQCRRECDPKDGWTCRDIGRVDVTEEDVHHEAPPKCACGDTVAGDVLCLGDRVCSEVPASGRCGQSLTKCFRTDAAMKQAVQVFTMVMSRSAASLDTAVLEAKMRSILDDEAAVIRFRYVCPTRSCPGGRCDAPEDVESACFVPHAGTHRPQAAQSSEVSVVAAEVASANSENLFAAFKEKKLWGVVAMSNAWDTPAAPAAGRRRRVGAGEGRGGNAFVVGGVASVGGLLALCAGIAFVLHRRTNGDASFGEGGLSFAGNFRSSSLPLQDVADSPGSDPESDGSGLQYKRHETGRN